MHTLSVSARNCVLLSGVIFIGIIFIAIPLVATDNWKTESSGFRKSDACMWGRSNYVNSNHVFDLVIGNADNHHQNPVTPQCHAAMDRYAWNIDGIEITSMRYDAATNTMGVLPSSPCSSYLCNQFAEYDDTMEDDMLHTCRSLCDCTSDCFAYQIIKPTYPVLTYRCEVYWVVEYMHDVCLNAPAHTSFVLPDANRSIMNTGWSATVGPYAWPCILPDSGSILSLIHI